MNVKLTIEYEEFPDENIKVLAVSKNDETVNIFKDEQARAIYRLLTGDPKAMTAARLGLLLD